MPTYVIKDTIRFGPVKPASELEVQIKKILLEVRPFYGDGVKDATQYLQLLADIGLSVTDELPKS